MVEMLVYSNRRNWRAVKTIPPTRLTPANPISLSNVGVQSTTSGELRRVSI